MYIVPPACLAGFVAGFFLWFVFVVAYKTCTTRILPKLRQRRRQQSQSTAGEGDEEAGDDRMEAGLRTEASLQIDPIPRAKLASSVHGKNSTSSSRRDETSLTPNGSGKERTSSSSSSSGAEGVSSGGSSGQTTDSGRESGSPSPASSEIEVSAAADKKDARAGRKKKGSR